MARRRPGAAAAAARAAMAARRLAAPAPATSSGCPTRGSTRGSPRGTSRSTGCARARRPGGAKEQFCCCAASGRCIPTGSCPPTSGPSATRIRRCTCGRRGRCTASTACATPTSSPGSSPSCCSTSVGGSTARIPTAATCSRAASWAGQHRVVRPIGPAAARLRLEEADATSWMAPSPRNVADRRVGQPRVGHHGHEVPRTLPGHRAGDVNFGPATLERRRRLLLRRARACRRQHAAARGAVDGRRAAAAGGGSARARPTCSTR